MSRSGFRATVEGPRPAAAWIMSLVASGTLWATEQLPFWIIAVQCLAFAVSYGTRMNPPGFRKSAIWLNVFMAGILRKQYAGAVAHSWRFVNKDFFAALMSVRNYWVRTN